MSSEDAKMSLFYSSISSAICTQQRKVEQILVAKGVQFESFDIASSEESKERMRKIMNDERGLAPQVANGDVYCGNFAQLIDANEGEYHELFEFLKLPVPPKQQQAQKGS